MYKLDLEKAEEPEIKLPTSNCIKENTREFQKNLYFCFIVWAKAFDCVDHNKLWKILQEMEIPRPTYLTPEKHACSVLKSKDIILPTKVHLVKAMVFLVVMLGCESWTHKEG